MWTQFKQVRVGASMDGMGQVVEYQRWPLKWSQAYKNLQKLDEYAQRNSNIMAWLACTVTAYNIWHIPEFMMWKLKESGFVKINSTRKRPVITHHVAHGPRRTNIKLLPKDVKTALIAHYDAWKLKFEKDNDLSEEVKKKSFDILNSIVKFMTSDDYSDSLPEFISFTRFIDQERNQNILDIVPEYKTIFENTL